MTQEEIVKELEAKIKRLNKELDIAHDCITELYNGHDSNVPIIKKYLNKIDKIKNS